MTAKNFFLLDVSKPEDEDGIGFTAEAGLGKKKLERNHHCYIDEDKGSIFVSQRNKGQQYLFWEMDLATLTYKR